ncbi:MAG TPA: FAD-binding protein, partial [Rhizobiaceae bacterium]|nr:FAD-binding protein [Rhizobiaceae bacterium]
MTVFTPGSEAEISQVVAESARLNRNLMIKGGGTRTLSSSASATRDTLSVEGLSGITLYEPAALTIGAKAGTPLADIEAAL